MVCAYVFLWFENRFVSADLTDGFLFGTGYFVCFLENCHEIYIYIHTHTHTHIYINFFFSYRQSEGNLQQEQADANFRMLSGPE